MWSHYGRVLRAPHVRGLVLASVLARIPLGIVAIAQVLFVQQATGSYGSAGAVTAVYALSAAILGVVMGRAIDRRGQTTILLIGLTVHVGGMLALVALGLSGAPVAALALCAAAAGALPPVSSCLRPLWPSLMRGDPSLVTAAYALDAILIETAFVIGPLLTGAVVAVLNPQAALLASVGFALTGTLWFAAMEPSRRWRGDPARRASLVGALAAPGLRTLTGAAVGVGVCFGTLEVALAAYGTDHGMPGLAGLLIALQALGSALGGLWYGANASRLGPTHVGFLVLLAAFGPCTALLVVAPTLGAIIGVAMLSGCVVAPLTAAQNLLAGALAPRGRVTEAFTWIVTALIVGIAIGNAAAGAIVDAGTWRGAVLFAVGAVSLCAVVATTRRRTLVPG